MPFPLPSLVSGGRRSRRVKKDGQEVRRTRSPCVHDNVLLHVVPVCEPYALEPLPVSLRGQLPRVTLAEVTMRPTVTASALEPKRPSLCVYSLTLLPPHVYTASRSYQDGVWLARAHGASVSVLLRLGSPLPCPIVKHECQESSAPPSCRGAGGMKGAGAGGRAGGRQGREDTTSGLKDGQCKRQGGRRMTRCACCAAISIG
jgi:hypothetical protein